jgi:uncharacterized protein YndB with AHSA1/START domain
MNETMSLRARVRAPVGDVRRALTDPEALRVWLAEHAEVDLPHRYEFWGRYTPEGAAGRQRLLQLDDHILRFSWLIGGEDTTVEIQLEREGPKSTILTLSQTHFPGWEVAVAESNVRGVLLTFWCLSIANLIDYLEDRELTPKCDFVWPEMRVQVELGGRREDVFDSLIDPAKFSEWFGAHVEIEPRLGGRFAMGGFELDPEPAKIVDLTPGRKLDLRYPDGMVASWQLADSDGKTWLTLVQSGFDDNQPPYGAWLGWLSGIAELRRYHELLDWRRVWLDVDMPGVPDGMLS